MPSRRRFLAGTASLSLPLLAGCQSLAEVGRSRTDYEYTLSFDRENSLADQALWKPADGGSYWNAERRAAWEAVTDGEPYVTYGYRPIPDEKYTERNGSYYALSTDVTGQKRIERSILRLRWVGRERNLDDPPDATPTGELPPFDGNAAMIAYFAARGRHSGGGAPWDGIERGGVVYRNAETVESELVPAPEHEYVSTHGTILRVEVVQRTLPEPEYTTTARKVADSAAAFAPVTEAALVETYLDTHSFSAAARRILQETKRQESYAETTPLSDEYKSVLEALELEESIYFGGGREPEGSRSKFLKWQGEHYRYGLYVNEAE